MGLREALPAQGRGAGGSPGRLARTLGSLPRLPVPSPDPGPEAFETRPEASLGRLLQLSLPGKGLDWLLSRDPCSVRG